MADFSASTTTTLPPRGYINNISAHRHFSLHDEGENDEVPMPQRRTMVCNVIGWTVLDIAGHSECRAMAPVSTTGHGLVQRNPQLPA
jgi:hypothetical protein